MKKNLLITLSGARPEILDRCPTERVKFESLGWAILITSVMAAVSMWFALTSALGLNPFGALPVALLWGLIIMGIDRWLVTSMPAGEARRWTIVIPRLLMALLLGSLISTPIVLRIFQSEINAQVAVIKAQQASQFLSQQASSQVGKQVGHWTKQVGSLQNVIDSGGTAAFPTSADPQLQALTKQRVTEQGQAKTLYQQWQCQLYGGAGCTVKGNGPLAQASEKAYRQAAAQVATLTNAIQARERHLSATDQASERIRVQQAKTALPGAQQQLNEAVARQGVLQKSFDARNEATNGLLIRLEALSQLSGKGFTLNAARILLFLLFLLIECLPVTVKLVQRPGNYEAVLRAAAEQELRQAKRAYRTGPPAPAPALPGAFAAAAPAAADQHAAREASLRYIWQEPIQDMTGWAPTVTAEPPVRDVPSQPADDTEEHTHLDDVALREMGDIRAAAGASWNGASSPTRPPDSGPHEGGIDLDYRADDL